MYLLAAANGSQIFLQNVDSKLALTPFPTTSTANGCAFSPDGSLLAVAHGASPNISSDERRAGAECGAPWVPSH